MAIYPIQYIGRQDLLEGRNPLRYIGGKSLMIDYINEVIEENTVGVQTVIDIFSGSGVVAENFKRKGYRVYANDFLYFSYVLLRGTVGVNNKPEFKKLGIEDPIEYLNNIDTNVSDKEKEGLFIYQNYSPHENCERMYFQNKNAIKIDLIRQKIEEWNKKNLLTEDEYFYLLAALIAAVPYVSNIAGVYGAYLKHWDDRTFNDLELVEPELIDNGFQNLCYNKDANELIEELEADLLYCDPPYNQRQYLPNYHILETIARYDYPKIKGVTGLREYGKEEKSLYSMKTEAKKAFEDLISKAKCKYILVSYNNEGILQTEEIEEILKKYGKEETYKLYEYPYRRYKSKIVNDAKGLKEQLYFIEKKVEKKKFIKSPMNYVGGKYRLLGQITKYFPKKIDTFVDLFCGGLDVAINIEANRVICNDINKYLIGIYKEFQKLSIDELLEYIDNRIVEYGLSKTNKEGYLKFRDYYNKTKNPLDLFVLVAHSFNYQFRFNDNHEYNNPFGANRSYFNPVMRKNLIEMHKKIKDFEFTSLNFKEFDTSILTENDFIYLDPPYTISVSVYNDGKRGFEGWGPEDDKALFEILDELNERKVKFALSNITEHKGIKNEELIEWSRKYNVYDIESHYNNCNYQAKSNANNKTREVLITNY